MARSRIAASAAALALISASIFGGALSAAAYTPGAPTLTGPFVAGEVVSTTTNATGPAFEGTMQHVDSGSETTIVWVSSDSGFSWSEYCLRSAEYFDPESLAHPWTCGTESVMSPGTYAFRASTTDNNSEDPGSQFSPTVSYTVVDNQPPTISSPLTGAATSDATPTFTGTGPALGTVTIAADGGTALCSAEVKPPGNEWSCESTIGLTLGDHSLAASALDSTGTPTAPSESQVLTIVPLDAPTIQQPQNPWYTTDPSVPITAEIPAGASTFEVWDWVETGDGTFTSTPYCITSVSTAAGTVTCHPTNELTHGANELYGVMRNEAGPDGPGQFGTTSSFFTLTLVDAPSIESPATDIFYTADSTPAFSGGADTMSTGVTVQTTDELITFCASEVAAGAWSCEAAAALDDGTYSYQARSLLPSEGEAAVDSEARTLVIDTVAPGAPTITTTGSVPGPYPTITGTAEPGSALTIYLDGAPLECTTPVVVADDGET